MTVNRKYKEGDRVGRRLTVGRFIGAKGYECCCDCGKICVVATANLSRQQSCGCWKSDVKYWKGRHHSEATKKKLSKANIGSNSSRYGKPSFYRGKFGKDHPKFIHGQRRDGATYVTWCGVKARCNNSKNPVYKYYGGRGVRVCKGWSVFTNFFDDMGERSFVYSIERIDNNGNYSCGKCEQCIKNHWPMNCRWATRKEQANNRRPRSQKHSILA